MTDGFVTKLNATGSALVYSTISAVPRTTARAASRWMPAATRTSRENALAGLSNERQAAFRRTYSGNYDMFVTKLNATGSASTYSTFIGGTQVDNGERVTVDASGNAYVLGFSSSLDFPTTAGAFGARTAAASTSR